MVTKTAFVASIESALYENKGNLQSAIGLKTEDVLAFMPLINFDAANQTTGDIANGGSASISVTPASGSLGVKNARVTGVNAWIQSGVNTACDYVTGTAANGNPTVTVTQTTSGANDAPASFTPRTRVLVDDITLQYQVIATVRCLSGSAQLRRSENGDGMGNVITDNLSATLLSGESYQYQFNGYPLDYESSFALVFNGQATDDFQIEVEYEAAEMLPGQTPQEALETMVVNGSSFGLQSALIDDHNQSVKMGELYWRPGASIDTGIKPVATPFSMLVMVDFLNDDNKSLGLFETGAQLAISRTNGQASIAYGDTLIDTTFSEQKAVFVIVHEAGTVQCYANGLLVGSALNVSIGTASSGFILGGMDTLITNYPQAFNKALSSSEVATLSQQMLY